MLRTYWWWSGGGGDVGGGEVMVVDVMERAVMIVEVEVEMMVEVAGWK